MSKRIFKYQINSVGQTSLPTDAVILHADEQVGVGMYVWVITDPDNVQRGPVDLRIVPTGGEVPVGAEFVNTLLINGGKFVFHVFKVPGN